MATFTLDLTNYREKVSCTVPDGRYLTRVTDVEVGNARSSGDSMATLWLTITEGDYAGEQFVTRVMLEGKGIFKTVEFLNALGQATPRQRLNINTQSWMNKLVYVDSVPGREFGGRTPSDVGGFIRYIPEKDGGSEPVQDTTPMDRETMPGADAVADPFTVAETPAQETPAASETETEAAPVSSTDEPETISLSDLEDL